MTFWQEIFGLSPGIPAAVVAVLGLLAIVLFVLLPVAAFVSYLDRKLGADLQARVGPNRVGLAGLLQPLADLIKALQKDVSKSTRCPVLFWLLIQTMGLFATLAALPLGSSSMMMDTEISAFLPFLSVLILALATQLLGLYEVTVPGIIGGIRVAALAFAGAFPALLAILCAGVRAGGFRWSILAEAQTASPFGWAIFSNPFLFVAVFVFILSGIILLGLPPMDAGFSQTDIRGGVLSGLQGRWLSLFKFIRFYGFFLWSVIAVVLFLGAWRLPEPVVGFFNDMEARVVLHVVELFYVLLKTMVVMICVRLAARVTPQIRADQITDFSLKVLSPFGLVALAGAAVLAGLGAII